MVDAILSSATPPVTITLVDWSELVVDTGCRPVWQRYQPYQFHCPDFRPTALPGHVILELFFHLAFRLRADTHFLVSFSNGMYYW